MNQLPSKAFRDPSAPHGSHFEPLEAPTLLSGEWSTEDTSGDWTTGMAADQAGNIYVAGAAEDAAGNQRSVVRQRSSGAAEWTTILEDAGLYIAGVARDDADNVFACGEGGAGTGASTWVVLKWPAGHAQFSVIDDFQPRNPVCQGLATDPAGNVFAIGTASVQTTTVDDYQLAPLKNAAPRALGVDLAGDVYAAGQAIDSAGQYHAIIRSEAAGAWTTSDDYQGAGGESAYAALATDQVTATPYAGGNWYPWFIRSAAGPAPSAAPAGFSTSSIFDTDTQDDALLDDVTSGDRVSN
jgi:hypothetical protein